MTTWNELKQKQFDERRKLLAQVLRKTKGNQTHAAKALGVSQAHVSRMIVQYQINA